MILEVFSVHGYKMLPSSGKDQIPKPFDKENVTLNKLCKIKKMLYVQTPNENQCKEDKTYDINHKD